MTLAQRERLSIQEQLEKGEEGGPLTDQERREAQVTAYFDFKAREKRGMPGNQLGDWRVAEQQKFIERLKE